MLEEQFIGGLMASIVSSVIRKLFNTFFASMFDSMELTYEEDSKKNYIRVSVFSSYSKMNKEINSFIQTVSQFAKYDVKYYRLKDSNNIELFFGFDVSKINKEKDIKFIKSYTSKVEKTYWGKKYTVLNTNHSFIENIFSIFNSSKCEYMWVWHEPDGIGSFDDKYDINKMALKFDMFLTDKKEAKSIVSKLNKLRTDSKEIILDIDVFHMYDFACKECEKSARDIRSCDKEHEHCKAWRGDVNSWEIQIVMVPDDFDQAIHIISKNYKRHKKSIQYFVENKSYTLWIAKEDKK